jgi:hypothetical protein
MSGSTRLLLLPLAVVAAACVDGVTASQGLDEPMRVQNAQLFDGPLPGLAPDDPAPSEGPTVTSVDLQNNIVYYAASDKRLAGHVQDTAVAVGLALPTLSNAHWVLPVGGRDPQFPGELSFVTSGSFHPDVPPGIHPLRVVAITEDGLAGRQRETPLCFRPPFNDNLHSCNPDIAPPAVVITLHWDRDVDLDMEIVTPDGRRVTPRRPRVDPEDPASPFIDRDSLRDCRPDGLRRESIVFQERPTGTWWFYVRFFESCGHDAVRFRLDKYEAEGVPPNADLLRTFERSGHLVSQYDMTGAEGPGLLVAAISFGD